MPRRSCCFCWVPRMRRMKWSGLPALPSVDRASAGPLQLDAADATFNKRSDAAAECLEGLVVGQELEPDLCS